MIKGILQKSCAGTTIIVFLVLVMLQTIALLRICISQSHTLLL